MSFVSYAQNFEDVVLWRALGNVEQGVYVDVGAADPEEHSVTHAFYESGWSGINIEPLPEHFERLVASRPRDLNLRIVAAREAGLCTLHAIAGTGLSTSDSSIAERHARAGWQSVPIVVPALPLSNILRDHPRETIHFLKIDVEGAEEAVLAGLDLTVVRPWIILVESTAPLSTEQTSAAWEPILLQCGYKFVYFDGLNRFYVAAERCELAERLAIPPNVFDDYVRAQDRRVQMTLDRERGETRHLRSETERLHLALAEAKQEAGHLSARVVEMEAQAAEGVRRAVELERLSARLSDVERQAAEGIRKATEFERSLARADSNAALLRGLLAAERQESATLRAEAERTACEIRELGGELERASAEKQALTEQTALLQYRLEATLASHSWRLTLPIRTLSRAVRAGAGGLLRSRLSQILRARKPRKLVLSQERLVECPARRAGAIRMADELHICAPDEKLAAHQKGCGREAARSTVEVSVVHEEAQPSRASSDGAIERVLRRLQGIAGA